MEMNLDLNLFFKPESTTEIHILPTSLSPLYLSKDWDNDPREENGEVTF